MTMIDPEHPVLPKAAAVESVNIQKLQKSTHGGDAKPADARGNVPGTTSTETGQPKVLKWCGVGALLVGGLCFATPAQATTYVAATCTLNSVEIDLSGDHGGNLTLVCVNAINGISFFAFPISKNPVAAQIAMQLFATVDRNCAGGSGNACTIIVYYDDNKADNPPFCGARNCRALNGVRSI